MMLFDQLFAADARDRLAIYLNDHRAGSVAGRRTATRCAEANEGTELGVYLRDSFLVELEREQDRLDQICDQLGIECSHLKSVLAVVASEAGRLKLNGRLVGYSPLSRIVELEALIAGVCAKLQLWGTLAHLALNGVEVADATELCDQARRQITELEGHHRHAVDQAFTAE